jgi:hypothetical protein
MRRREFITLLGGAAVAWPLAPRSSLRLRWSGFLPLRRLDRVRCDWQISAKD